MVDDALNHCFSDLNVPQSPLESLVNTDVWVPPARIVDSVDLW